MRRFVRLALVLAVIVLPLPASVDDDWKNLYIQAQHTGATRDFAQAEALYNKALRTAELFGKTDPRVASTLQGLGTTLRSEKKPAEAEDAFRRAAEIYTLDPGVGSLVFARIHFDLAGVLMDEGKYDAALQSLKRLLPVFDELLGPHDVDSATALCMQGDSYRMLKMFSNAEPPLKRCADLRSDDGGIGTAEFGEAANSLALVYQHLGKYSAADSYFRLAGKIRELFLGITSPELADTLEAYASLLHQLGRDAEAKQKERLAAAIRARAGKK